MIWQQFCEEIYELMISVQISSIPKVIFVASPPSTVTLIFQR